MLENLSQSFPGVLTVRDDLGDGFREHILFRRSTAGFKVTRLQRDSESIAIRRKGVHRPGETSKYRQPENNGTRGTGARPNKGQTRVGQEVSVLTRAIVYSLSSENYDGRHSRPNSQNCAEPEPSLKTGGTT